MLKKLLFVGLLLIITPLSHTILVNSNSKIYNEKTMNFVHQCKNNEKVLNIDSFYGKFDIHFAVQSITIKDCDTVTLGGNTLNNLGSLRIFEIINVRNLILSDSALNWTGYRGEYDIHEQPSISFNIQNTRVKRMPKYVFKGAPTEIVLRYSQFDSIEAFSFASLTHVKQIIIEHCQFQQIQTQAFKGIETKKIIIDNSTFGILPSSAFRDIKITETFTIVNSKFNTIKSNAFIVDQPKKFEILNTYFDNLEAQGFLIRTKGIVIIRNNYFQNLDDRAFLGISLIKEFRNTPNQELLFTGNKLNNFKKDSIKFETTSFTPKFGAIYLNKSCSCVETDIWVINNEISEYIHCINNTLRQTTMQVEIYRKQICESGTKTWLILVSVFSVILVLLVIGIIVFVIMYKKYKERKLKNYINRGRDKKGSVGMIVPDGRTYRETEVHVIVEKAELLTTEL